MSQLLETLYLSACEGHQTEAEAKALRAAEEIVETVGRKLTREEFDAFWNAALSVGDADCLNSFTLGFRLGVQLTLEGLRPVDWIAP